MKIDVIDLSNKKKGTVELSADIYDVVERKDILHRVVRWQLAKRRAGTHATKTYNTISGTTKKPWRQKGTGRARAGSMRAPQMRGGITVFGPVVREHAISLPKKVRQLGLKSALSSKLRAGDLIVIESLEMKDGKTKQAQDSLKQMNITSGLFVDNDVKDAPFTKAISNLPHVNVLATAGLNVYDILRHEKLVLTKNALDQVEGRLK